MARGDDVATSGPASISARGGRCRRHHRRPWHPSISSPKSSTRFRTTVQAHHPLRFLVEPTCEHWFVALVPDQRGRHVRRSRSSRVLQRLHERSGHIRPRHGNRGDGPHHRAPPPCTGPASYTASARAASAALASNWTSGHSAWPAASASACLRDGLTMLSQRGQPVIPVSEISLRLQTRRRPTDRARASCDNRTLTQRAKCVFVYCVAPDDSATEEWNNTCEYW